MRRDDEHQGPDFEPTTFDRATEAVARGLLVGITILGIGFIAAACAVIVSYQAAGVVLGLIGGGLVGVGVWGLTR